MTVHRFTAYGLAAPQGSQESRYVASLGRTVSHEKRAVISWRNAVAQAAGEQCRPCALIDGPCEIDVTVYRPRPKSLPKRVAYPATAPDADKLLRAIGDALEGVLYVNDSRIVTATVRKRFGEPARVEVVVRSIDQALDALGIDKPEVPR